MRNGNNEEVGEMVIEEAELEDLDKFEARLTKAYALSGEPPSRGAIEYIEETVALPERGPADYARFNEAVRKRIDKAMRAATGAENIGAWVKHARQRASIDERRAARESGVRVPAYQQFEAGRMPVWRLPARSFAHFCSELALDLHTMIRWAGVSLPGARAGVYGRLDIEGEEGSDALGELAVESERKSREDFEAWRLEFIAASSGGSSGDDVRRER